MPKSEKGHPRHIIIQNQSSVLSSGTGIVVKSDGTLITAKHVIENGGVYHGRITAKGIETATRLNDPLKIEILLATSS